MIKDFFDKRGEKSNLSGEPRRGFSMKYIEKLQSQNVNLFFSHSLDKLVKKIDEQNFGDCILL